MTYYPKVNETTALVILITNIFAPGIGTMAAGIIDGNGVNMKLVLFGLLQLIIIIVGWIWAVIWSISLYRHAKKDKKTQVRRKKAAHKATKKKHPHPTKQHADDIEAPPPAQPAQPVQPASIPSSPTSSSPPPSYPHPAPLSTPEIIIPQQQQPPSPPTSQPYDQFDIHREDVPASAPPLPQDVPAPPPDPPTNPESEGVDVRVAGVLPGYQTTAM